MLYKKNFLTILLISIVFALAGASFGIEMGWTITDLQQQGIEAELVQPNYYLLDTPPNPHNSFDSYIVRTDPDEGIFWIKALGKDISVNSYGTQLKTEYEKINSQLSSIYGVGEKVDFLFYDSIWDEADDWMYGLKVGERFFYTSWEDIEDESIKKVFVGANATSSSSGYISVEYYSPNYDSLKQKAENRESAAF